MLFLLLLLPSLLAALLALGARPYRPWVGRVNALLSLLALGAALAIAAQTTGGTTPVLGPGDLLRADSLSALFMVCVAFVGALALWFSPGLAGAEPLSAGQLRRFHVCINLFLFAMLAAVSANNVGIMWIAVEATTIFSALLIPLTVTRASVEASWKYILICSAGIALAFAGTVLAYFDFVTLSGHAENALNWPVLLAAAPHLNPYVLRLAFVFLLIGYGTKAGIAPMHTWLPDAHSEAPSPLSAAMSGVLLAVALYMIMRWKAVVDAALGSAFTDALLIGLGMLSLGIAALHMVQSRNYKRMLAYSSIEHTGLMCIGLGLGPLGVFAMLLHLISHTAAKSMLFILSGHILHRYHSTEIKDVAGLLKLMPQTAVLFSVGMLALIGLPPFGLFISEFALIRAGFAAGQPWLMGAVLLLLAIAFVALLRSLNRMLYGAPAVGLTAGAMPSPSAEVATGIALQVPTVAALPRPDGMRASGAHVPAFAMPSRSEEVATGIALQVPTVAAPSRPDGTAPLRPDGVRASGAHAPAGDEMGRRRWLLLVNVAVLVVLGLTLPAPLQTLLDQIVGLMSK